MSVDQQTRDATASPGVAALLQRAAGADSRARTRLRTAIDDFFLSEDDRLDDRTRAALVALLTRAVAMIEREIAGHTAKLLQQSGDVTPPTADERRTLDRLIGSQVLRDPVVMTDLIDQVRQDLLAEALAAHRAPDATPDLLPRLMASEDGVVASAAAAYLGADTRRRNEGRADIGNAAARTIAWWVAAVLRERHAADPRRDRALADATRRSLNANESADRLETAALRLATALSPEPHELGDLIASALDDGHAALAIAAIAISAGIDHSEARRLVLDPSGDRLWLCLRAYGLDRASIARIGLLLAEADHRRDLETFADMLDDIAAVPEDEAAQALAIVALPSEFRDAVRALERDG